MSAALETISQKLKFVGQKFRKRPRRALSEYGRMLREKQALKEIYGLRERQFKKYVKEALSKRGRVDIGDYLVKRLEKRLDNVVFRLSLAETRRQARQMVSHGHFLVNGKKVKIPSFEVKKGDKIEVRPSSKNKGLFKDLKERLKDRKIPSWLKLDFNTLSAQVIGEPTLEEVNLPVQLSLVFEFYAK